MREEHDPQSEQNKMYKERPAYCQIVAEVGAGFPATVYDQWLAAISWAFHMEN